VTFTLRPPGARNHVLHPGGVVLAEAGDRLQTLLGSCVAVVMTDPRRTVGTMCHIVHARGEARAGAVAPDTAWGDAALDAMYELLRARGIQPRLCQAWVYGGGHMFPALGRGAGDVGAINAHWTLQALALDGVQVLHHDLGGRAYRRLAWTVGSGEPEIEAVAVDEAGAPASRDARPGAVPDEPAALPSPWRSFP
jgi:chemotaxis protein CheD